ncbi:CaiB/BaiF CoA transferase family protein [Chloroflexota bacterium]
MKGVLDGIKIVEMCIGQQGPYAGVMLGDLGADIIKIEDRVKGDHGRGHKRLFSVVLPELAGHRTYYFEANNRNKRGITLDLKKEKAREVVYKLVKESDVFMQNMRNGVAARLGVDYATLSQINPKLVYGSASAFGAFGPDSDKPGFDIVGQARSGLIAGLGEEDMPPTLGPAGTSDQVGAMMLAFGILAALVGRERTGVGQEIHASLLGSTLCLMGLAPALRSLVGIEMPRSKRTKAENALWNIYKCSDDQWICLAHRYMWDFWEEFCRVIGHENLATDPRFCDPDAVKQNIEQLIAELDSIFATRPRDEWIRILSEGGDFIYAPVNDMGAALEDPQVMANGYVVEYDHPVLGKVKLLGHPVTYSKSEVGPRLPAPEHGQHTEEVLLELGYTWNDIEQMKDQEVI